MYNYSGCRHRFVVQRHDAQRAGLHYDIRLEINGGSKCTLVSWATRKLPLLLSGKEKRIGMYKTEPHDLSWLRFEGEIGSGYGKGVVQIFDFGTFEVVKQKQNVDVLKFNGQKLNGLFAIVKVRPDFYIFVRVTNIEEIMTSVGNIVPYISPTYRTLLLLHKKKRRFKRGTLL